MRTSFRSYHPEERLLLPADPRECLAKGHLAFFVPDTIDALDLKALVSRKAPLRPRPRAGDPAPCPTPEGTHPSRCFCPGSTRGSACGRRAHPARRHRAAGARRPHRDPRLREPRRHRAQGPEQGPRPHLVRPAQRAAQPRDRRPRTHPPAVRAQIPAPRQHLVRYGGWYSSRARGDPARSGHASSTVELTSIPTTPSPGTPWSTPACRPSNRPDSSPGSPRPRTPPPSEPALQSDRPRRRWTRPER